MASELIEKTSLSAASAMLGPLLMRFPENVVRQSRFGNTRDRTPLTTFAAHSGKRHQFDAVMTLAAW